jgi:methionyl-tRNA formyltransferase
MRLIFAGTPEFSVAALAAIFDAGHEITLVLTQPDRPAGRGMRPRPSAVKAAALARLLPVTQPSSLRDPGVQRLLASLRPDAMVVAAYGLLLPAVVLEIPRHGCLNIHASLLPRWRGAAPIQRAILAGDPDTGISIMQMDENLDTGAVGLVARTEIGAEETAGELHDRLAALGAQLIVGALRAVEEGVWEPAPQSAVGVSYAAKITKDETEIDWTRSAAEIARRIRAFNPVPAAHTAMHGTPVKIWGGVTDESVKGVPGDIVAASRDGIVVACGAGGLVIRQLQLAGGRRLDAGAFLAGHALSPSARFG